MGWFITSTIIGATMFLVPVLLSVLSQSKTTKGGKVLRYPVFVSIIGIVDLLICIIVVVGAILSDQGLDPLVIMPPVVFVGMYLILLPINWRIYVEKEYFIFRNVLGVKRKYFYHDITKIKIREDNRYYKLYISKKKITVDDMVTNYESFLNKLKKEKVLKNVEVIFIKNKRDKNNSK